MKCACYARFVFPSVAANKNTKKHASIIICEWHFALCFSAICDVFWRVGKTRTDGSLRSSACAEFWCGQWFFLFVFVVKTISIFSLIIPWSIKSTEYAFILWPRSVKQGPKFGKNWPETKILFYRWKQWRPVIVTTTRCIKFGTHT